MKENNHPPYYDPVRNQVVYPWLKWLKQRVLMLHRGTHYACMSHSMAQQVRNAARRYGYSVSIKVDDDGLMITPRKAPRRGKRVKKIHHASRTRK